MLYIIGTPIGNLQDLSYRQAKTLAESEIIVTEDTRSTGTLLKRIPEMFSFQMKSPQRYISYYKEKEFEKLPEIIEMLENGQDMALISQAGLPLVSDPGYLLVKTCAKRGVPFTVIPGPSAVTTALLYSGFNPENFMFLGFLPKKDNEIIKLLHKAQEVETIMKKSIFIFFESPQRINSTLELIDNNFPDAHLCVTREMTKMYEEIIRGKAHELKEREYRGEITVVLTFS